jgi:hypothetical protein
VEMLEKFEYLVRERGFRPGDARIFRVSARERVRGGRV